jgi:HSP20 family protein
MKKQHENNFDFRIIEPSIISLFHDDVDSKILSPLSYLKEFGTYWLLEFDLPLVNKKDIRVTFDENTISIEAKLKEIYSEEKLGIETKFQYFKKTLTLPKNININKTSAKFVNGILRIIIPKKISGQKIKVI